MKPIATSRVRVVNVSLASFVRIIAILFAIVVLWALRDIIMLIFISMVLAATISPWVKMLERRRIPRIAGVVLMYCIIISVILAFVLLLIPAVRDQITSLSNAGTYQKVFSFFSKSSTTGVIASNENISLFSRGIFAGLRGVLGGFASFLLVLVITFYFTIDEENIRQFWIRLIPRQYRDRLSRVGRLTVDRIGAWFRGQLAVSLLIGVLCYLAYTLLGVPNALLLALISGVAAFVPIVGAVIGIVPAVLLALSVNEVTALIVLAVGIGIHQFITNAIVPKVMSKAVGLNPVVIIIVMLIGARLAGAIGLILAIPIASIVDIVFRELKIYREQKGAYDA
ncbi:MAG: AI-2E family transporter [Candidatus Kerfeldbacteria bacterium]